MKVVQLYSVHQATLYEQNFTFIAPDSTKLAYLGMLSNLELASTAGSAGQLKIRQHAQISQLWQKPC